MFDAILEKSTQRRAAAPGFLIALGAHLVLVPVFLGVTQPSSRADAKTEDLFVSFVHPVPPPKLMDMPLAAGNAAENGGRGSAGDIVATKRPVHKTEPLEKTPPKPTEPAAKQPVEAKTENTPAPDLPRPLTVAPTLAAAAPSAGAPTNSTPAIGVQAGGNAAATGAPGSGYGSGVGTGTGTGVGSGSGVAGNVGSVLAFGEGMTRPNLVSKVDPLYPREAIEAKVEGLMLTKCVITTDGHLQNCRIVKGLPHLDQAVLTALKNWRYSPVMFQGRAVNVEYVIPVRLMLPR